MVVTEVEEQIKPLANASLLQTKIPKHNFIIPQGEPEHFYQTTQLENPYKTATDLFTDNADFINYSLAVMDDSLLI